MSSELALLPPTVGAILAGGLARRMGGGDKPLRVIGGRTALARIVDRLTPQTVRLIIRARSPVFWPRSTGPPLPSRALPGW